MTKWRNVLQGLRFQTGLRFMSTTFPNIGRTFNQVQLLGRVGREPKEVNLANADVKFTAFPLVTSLRVKRPDDEARPEGERDYTWREVWHSVQVTRPWLQDYVLNNVRMGSRVFVTGKLCTYRVNLANDEYHYNTFIHVDEVVYLNPPMEAKGHVKNEDIKNEEDTVEEEQEKLS